MPFTDVYDQGGPEAFRHLERHDEKERNLIVLPFSFIDMLSELETKENSMGARDALLYIKDSGYKKIDSESSNGKNLYRLSQGLDLLILTDEQYSGRNLSIFDLKKDLEKYVSFREFEIITNDTRDHIKYSGGGVKVSDPEFLQVNESIVHEGVIDGNDELQAALRSSKSESLELDKVEKILDRELYMNQFIRFRSNDNKEYFARVAGKLEYNHSKTRIIGVNAPVVELLNSKEYSKRLTIGNSHFDNVLGVKPRDMEQYLALQYGLLNDDVSVFFLCGKAGSGKTLLTYAAAVDSVLVYDGIQFKDRYPNHNEKTSYRIGDRGRFKQIALLKPPEILGGARRDPGALPGTLLDKLTPHLRPYSDAHRETIMNAFPFDEMFRHPKYENRYGPPRNREISDKRFNAAKLPNCEIIDLVYSGFIGGASISDTNIILDEAQDYTPYEMKTIIERTAEGSKLIICGDPMQTRNPKCTTKTNGLTFAVRHFLPKPYTGLVYLNRNYRHQASEDSDSMRAYNK